MVILYPDLNLNLTTTLILNEFLGHIYHGK